MHLIDKGEEREGEKTEKYCGQLHRLEFLCFECFYERSNTVYFLFIFKLNKLAAHNEMIFIFLVSCKWDNPRNQCFRENCK